MTAEELKQAGFSDAEIAAYNPPPSFDISGKDAEQAQKLIAAGFNEREIAEHFSKKGKHESPKTQQEPSFISKLSDNLVPSAIRFGENIVTPFIHPIDTAHNISDVIAGGVENLIFPYIDKFTHKAPPPTQAQQKAAAFGTAMKDRYGGIKNIKNTVATDPIGSLADISSIASLGAGSMVRIPAMARYASIPAKIAEYTNPVSLVTKPVAGAFNMLSKTSIPESIYARTMKIPPGSLNDTERANVLNTLVRDEKLPLGSKTVEKINKIVGDLESGINAAIDMASSNGSTINVAEVLWNLENLKQTYRNRPKPERYYNAIDSVKKDIIEHDFNNRVAQTNTVTTQSQTVGPSGQPLTSTHQVTTQVPTGEIPFDKGTNLKKGIYQEIQDYYMKRQRPETGRVGIRNDVDAAAKANVARSIKDQIMASPDIPQAIKNDMRREAGLMNARKWVERATNRGGNLDPVSLSGMMFGVLVEKGLPAVAAWKIAMSQPVMSRFAISLAKSRSALSATKANAAFQVGRASNIVASD